MEDTDEEVDTGEIQEEKEEECIEYVKSRHNYSN